MKNKLNLRCFCCSLKYIHDMDTNFGYVVVYGMFSVVTKVDSSLTCRYSIMIYVSFMLI
jgi:hypothetical protein